MDQILIERKPAFSICPIHHCEKGEPRVTDDRNAFGAQGRDGIECLIHPSGAGFDIPSGGSLGDHDRHAIAFPCFTKDDFDLMPCGSLYNSVSLTIWT